jgi:hypothetical protein
LEELGWTLAPPGEIAHWDGLLDHLLRIVEADVTLLHDATTRAWNRAAREALRSDRNRTFGRGA